MKHLNATFVFFAAIYLAGMEYFPGYSGVLLKAIPVLILIHFVIRHKTGNWHLLMFLALFFSVGGDVLLALNEIYGGLFVAGLGSFLVAQVIYAGLFWSHRSTDPGRVKYALAFFPFAAILAMIVVPASGELMAPVMLYILAITLMVMGAALCNRPLSLLFTGALLFALSDSLIAVDKFLLPLPLAGILIMVTYYAAQYMIVKGAISEPEEKKV